MVDIIERVIKKLERARKEAEEAQEAVNFANKLGIDVTEEELRLEQAMSRIRQLEEVISEELEKRKMK